MPGHGGMLDRMDFNINFKFNYNHNRMKIHKRELYNQGKFFY